jgi:hypothetical protein
VPGEALTRRRPRWRPDLFEGPPADVVAARSTLIGEQPCDLRRHLTEAIAETARRVLSCFDSSHPIGNPTCYWEMGKGVQHGISMLLGEVQWVVAQDSGARGDSVTPTC